jgi:hypothetical protein
MRTLHHPNTGREKTARDVVLAAVAIKITYFRF